ncbi:MAG: prolipoprotein diacylglyceryl transferase [Alphaproteobacteria bacterium]|nr:prolipoprotein diacylglyceryl transferase [Alphaproteobacteria bacterium]
MFFTLTYPIIDPVVVQLGPLAIRWYALAYVAGIILGWWYGLYLCSHPRSKITKVQFEDIIVWATLGIILGGRLGYVLFYNTDYYFHNPLKIIAVWEGGMSFHGGLLGTIIAMILYARYKKLSFFVVSDIMACATPIGLFFGRLANFINGELYGKVAIDLPWAMVFPRGGPFPRHPSQLYEAFLEGIALFTLLFIVIHVTKARFRPGLISGIFLIFYGTSRFIIEYFREPDAQIGYLFDHTSMGQLLSVPMILVGIIFIIYARKRTQPMS